MIDIINIDKNILILNEISVGEYLWIEQMLKHGSVNIVDISVIGKVDIYELQSKGFIKIMPTDIILREKAKELFEVHVDNFHRFLNTFPVKTPSGRYLSPAGTEGVTVNNLKRKWNSLFKGNKVKEDHVIKVLEAEVAYRRKEQNFNYMTACEAWLNGAFYEKYEYLLEDQKGKQEIDNYELM